jgi:hypothetical protein
MILVKKKKLTLNIILYLFWSGKVYLLFFFDKGKVYLLKMFKKIKKL